MQFDPVLLAPRREPSIAAGLWYERTINDALDACVARTPARVALTAMRLDGDEAVRRFTYRQLATMADRIAVGLYRLGVRKNDVVSMQLPNSWEFSLLYLACSRIGAVLNPLMPIFRERELSFMLQHGEAKIFVVPKSYRGFDHASMARALQPSLPHLQRVIVVDEDGADGFTTLLSGPAWEDDADAAHILHASRPTPDDITQLLYTSGTTGEPKGVMHTANTLFANVVPYAERARLTADDVILMASPMAHQTGFLYGLMLPIELGAHVVLHNLWNPDRAAQAIRDEGVSFTMASTPFLTDLTRSVVDSGQPVPTLRTFLCAGAPIPGPLVEQAQAGLGVKIASAWGMTENGAVTIIDLDDPAERAVNTDGKPLHGTEVKVVDANDEILPSGEPGRLLVRSSSNFVGYLKRPQWNATSVDGWFDTGDMAYVDEAGYIRISGRSKDVIIRGGENIPVFEVEAALYRHPAVAQVAVVAYADPRLGERACAVVVPKEGAQIDFDGMIDFLKEQKFAMQYLPERLVVVEAMPATPSGKIQKFKLRGLLKEQLEQAADKP